MLNTDVNVQRITQDHPITKTLDITNQNIEQLKQLFPEVFQEGKIDFDALKTTLGEAIDDSNERYNFTWNGKTKAKQMAQTPSTGTLRPCKAESVNWDSTENLFIEGDNLEVLKLLQKSYHKKVKMIYIDPPYNTGKDFVYRDNFHDNMKNYLEQTGQVDGEGRKLSSNPETSGRYHSDWLNMMYPRLKLARNLLKDDGVIFISIDDNEVENLKKMCNEIFGEENFVGTFTRKSSSGSKNDSERNQIIKTVDYIHIYSKSDFYFNPEFIQNKKNFNLEDKQGFFSTRALEMQGGDDTLPLRPKMGYSIYYNEQDIQIKFDYDLNKPNVYEPFDKELLQEGFKCYRPRKRGSKLGIWRWGADKFAQEFENDNIYFSDSRVYFKERKKEYIEKYPDSLISDFLNTQGTNELKKMFDGESMFSFPKPVDLIKRVVEISIATDDIILDFFAGSCTTAHAVMKQNQEDGKNRKYICVQLPELLDEKHAGREQGYQKISDISLARIKLADKDVHQDTTLSGVKVFKLDTTNIRPWDTETTDLQASIEDAMESIKLDRNSDDVLYEILLKYGLELTTPIETLIIEGEQVFNIGFGALIVCLAEQLTLELIEGIAELKHELDPETIQIVFKDSGFHSSNMKTNAMQILKQAGIHDVKSI